MTIQFDRETGDEFIDPEDVYNPEHPNYDGELDDPNLGGLVDGIDLGDTETVIQMLAESDMPGSREWRREVEATIKCGSR